MPGADEGVISKLGAERVAWIPDAERVGEEGASGTKLKTGVAFCLSLDSFATCE